MSAIDQLFEQYKAAHSAGQPDPTPFLEQAEGAEREQLSALINFYLERAPRRAWDPEAYAKTQLPELVESLSRSVQGSAGLWPALLPRLRERARVKRADLVAELAARLGAQGKQEKVAGYYHEMEQGLLPAAGVSDKVLEALGKIVGESAEALRQAGSALAPGAGPAEGAAYARTAKAPADAEAASGPAAPGTPDEELDEVDRLFRGG